jgi:hypothetical protein
MSLLLRASRYLFGNVECMREGDMYQHSFRIYGRAGLPFETAVRFPYYSVSRLLSGSAEMFRVRMFSSEVVVVCACFSYSTEALHV